MPGVTYAGLAGDDHTRSINHSWERARGVMEGEGSSRSGEQEATCIENALHERRERARR